MFGALSTVTATYVVKSLSVLITVGVLCQATDEGNLFSYLQENEEEMLTECGVVDDPELLPRVFGGHVARPDQYPWMAYLSSGFLNSNGEEFDYFLRCGGSLISNRHVLTAAHCVRNRNDEFKLNRVIIRLGAYNLVEHNPWEKNYEIYPQDVIVHHQYDPESLFNDISVIRLPENTQFKENIRPICLPFNYVMDKYEDEGESVKAAGWGTTNPYSYGRRSDVLKVSEETLLSKRACSKRIGVNNFNIDTEICTTYSYHGGITCKGDSGGPLMTIKKYTPYSTKAFVIGVTSHEPAIELELSCGTGYPSVYTDVSAYLEWILEIMEE
uniref:Peptidase S1 domain-containing protein n=1 Tax=Graphocephala atropunctata TaxID=36148 RepID=A0A1B6MBZ3_9HEMI